MSCVHSGQASVRPLSDPVGVIGFLGGIEAQVGYASKREEFMCAVCALDDEEEFEAVDEQEQAEAVSPLLTPFQPTMSQHLEHCITHSPYQSWCPHCVGARGRDLGITPM